MLPRSNGSAIIHESQNSSISYISKIPFYKCETYGSLSSNTLHTPPAKYIRGIVQGSSYGGRKSHAHWPCITVMCSTVLAHNNTIPGYSAEDEIEKSGVLASQSATKCHAQNCAAVNLVAAGAVDDILY